MLSTKAAENPTTWASLTVAVFALVVAAGCGEEVPRPPITWEGEHIRFGTDADVELCAGTLPYLDAVAGHLKDVFQTPGTPIDYYWLPDGVERYCDGEALGCNLETGEVFSTLAILQHEVVHAVRRPHVSYLPLEEGLAEAFGDDWEPVYPVSGDIEYLLREYDRSRVMPGNAYPLAGHFVSYLRAEHGMDSLMALGRTSNYQDSFSNLENEFREIYGVDLVEELDRYKDAYPICDQTFSRDLSFDCSRNVVAAPVRPDDTIEVSVSMSCDDPTVLGPRFDHRWTTVTLDVQVSGLYYVFAGKPDLSGNDFIRLRTCETSCFDRPEAVYDAPFIGGQMCLEQGRYLFRFAEDVNSDDYLLKVAMVEPSCS